MMTTRKMMKLSTYVFSIFVAMLAIISCRNKSTDETIISANIISIDRTIKENENVVFSELIYVTNGATLTIEAGATVRFTKGKTALIITRGSKLIAKGAANKPITFTSAEVNPSPGDWGGIVILGNATTNASYNGQNGVGQIEGGIDDIEGRGLYGGSNDADNSGVLQYIRINYAGYAFEPDKEINSLTMGAVGNGTTIDHIQVAYAQDDAYEWFGGTVNCKYLIAYATLDDDFDCDNGYRGKVQYGLVVRDVARADKSKSNFFEIDNDASGSSNTPFTAPIFSNITIVGPKQNFNTNYQSGAHIRRNSAPSIFNSIFIGSNPEGIRLDGEGVKNNATSGALSFENNYVGGQKEDTLLVRGVGNKGFVNKPTAEAYNWATTQSFNNIIENKTTFDANSNIQNIFNAYVPTTKITGAAFTNAKLNTFFDKVDYKGATADASTIWWTGWTNLK